MFCFVWHRPFVVGGLSWPAGRCWKACTL
jgi:hypothetical protein